MKCGEVLWRWMTWCSEVMRCFGEVVRWCGGVVEWCGEVVW